MRKIFIFVFLLGFVCPTTSLIATTVSSDPSKPLKANVVLDATPIRVKPLKASKGVDALEKSPEEMGPSARVVVFRINRVLRGELAPIQMNELSLMDQAKDAAGDKDFLKLVTMDFKRPEGESAEKRSFSMVVADPTTSFGIKEGEESSKQRYRLSLARVHKKPDSYVLIKSEKI